LRGKILKEKQKAERKDRLKNTVRQFAVADRADLEWKKYVPPCKELLTKKPLLRHGIGPCPAL
jgi:hypothetical protein